jgi:hypothetical protein
MIAADEAYASFELNSVSSAEWLLIYSGIMSDDMQKETEVGRCI